MLTQLQISKLEFSLNFDLFSVINCVSFLYLFRHAFEVNVNFDYVNAYILLLRIHKLVIHRCFVFFCFDLGFHTSNPVIKYRPDASCMSYMEARAEMP